jgi:hypothetical protein
MFLLIQISRGILTTYDKSVSRGLNTVCMPVKLTVHRQHFEDYVNKLVTSLFRNTLTFLIHDVWL